MTHLTSFIGISNQRKRDKILYKKSKPEKWRRQLPKLAFLSAIHSKLTTRGLPKLTMIF